MRVVKVLNNSLVLALDNAGQETILMERESVTTNPSGISFGRVRLKRFLS